MELSGHIKTPVQHVTEICGVIYYNPQTNDTFLSSHPLKQTMNYCFKSITSCEETSLIYSAATHCPQPQTYLNATHINYCSQRNRNVEERRQTYRGFQLSGRPWMGSDLTDAYGDSVWTPVAVVMCDSRQDCACNPAWSGSVLRRKLVGYCGWSGNYVLSMQNNHIWVSDIRDSSLENSSHPPN